MSANAFEEGERAVAIVDESTLFVAAKKKRKRRGDGDEMVKRGARCVDEEQDDHVAKATRRTASTTDEHQLLLREAEVVLSTLIAHTKKATTDEPAIDPMLCDHRALFEAAAAKYLKTQQRRGKTATFPSCTIWRSRVQGWRVPTAPSFGRNRSGRGARRCC